ncbi:MAG: hypothetical protein EBV86_01330 [Marivivens sp.]|nr:hypothetical protein [Marivivens sp.]NCW67198.1 hypothetical protein [Marivivens sp.]
MTDNLDTQPGIPGGAIKTDYDGEAHYQIVKLAVGEDNERQAVSDDQAMPVTSLDSVLLQEILVQLKMLNAITQEFSGVKIERKDVCSG